MALLFKSDTDRAEQWSAALKRYDSKLEVRVWPDAGSPADIEYALVWKPQQGLLKRFPNLKAIFSLGAGVDHLFRDPDLPAGVPVALVRHPAEAGVAATRAAVSVAAIVMCFPYFISFAPGAVGERPSPRNDSCVRGAARGAPRSPPSACRTARSRTGMRASNPCCGSNRFARGADAGRGRSPPLVTSGA